MDIQNIINPVCAKKYIENYDKRRALSIALSPREHYLLTKYRVKNFNSLKNLIREEIQSMQNYTDVPEDVVQSISVKINKTL